MDVFIPLDDNIYVTKTQSTLKILYRLWAAQPKSYLKIDWCSIPLFKNAKGGLAVIFTYFVFVC
jgi:hypothetical protein